MPRTRRSLYASSLHESGKAEACGVARSLLPGVTDVVADVVGMDGPTCAKAWRTCS